jgi:hypothetical protein
LRDALSALLRDPPDVRLDVIVVERCGEPVRRQVREMFPSVRADRGRQGRHDPEMRALAFDAATAPAVAVIEDHVIVPPGWARGMLNALGAGDRVVGGAVKTRRRRPRSIGRHFSASTVTVCRR